MRNYEYQEQVTIVNFLRDKYPSVLFNADCGGVRTTIRQAVKAKLSGHSKGFPDLAIYEPKNGFHGLFIELKTAKTHYSNRGTVSTEQKDWINKLNERGYKAEVCYGSGHAIQVVSDYLKDLK